MEWFAIKRKRKISLFERAKSSQAFRLSGNYNKWIYGGVILGETRLEWISLKINGERCQISEPEEMKWSKNILQASQKD